VKFAFLSQKTLFLGQKAWKNFGKSLETVFSKCLEISEILEIVLLQNFGKLQKMMLNSNFGNRKKLNLTRKPTQKFG